MMRTVEIFMVALILFTAFGISSYFAVLPSPRMISSQNLRELALSTLETLDANGDFSRTVFTGSSDPSWTSLQIALASSLPPNIVYNLTIYYILTSSDGVVTYSLLSSFSNSPGNLGVGSDAASYVVTSSNVTFTTTPQKIGENIGKNITLYILNCNDANGWWITGYTAQSLASDLRNLLSPYFQTTVLVNTTYQLGLILNGTSLLGETLQDSVVINTFGEAVPIPTSYANMYPRDSYAEYFYQLGRRVNLYNWTWVSIVGYPCYYVTNNEKFASTQNSWGIYGMKDVGSAGLNSFLRGLDYPSYPSYSYDGSWITGSPGVVQFTWNASYYSNYYGIYPSPYQTSTRALPTSILNTYHLNVKPNSHIFQRKNNYIAGATFDHQRSGNPIQGSLTAIGLTRTPDIRITALGLLQHYCPTIYKSEFGASGTSRLMVLQLTQQGGA
jgi:hypothetical protein